MNTTTQNPFMTAAMITLMLFPAGTWASDGSSAKGVLGSFMSFFGGNAQPEQSAEQTEKHRNYIVGVTPFYGEETKEQIEDFLLKLLLERIPVGSDIALYNAYSLEHVADVEIPDHEYYAKLKGRIKRLKPAMLDIRRFLKNSKADPDKTGEIDVPGFIQHLAQMGNENRDTSLIIIGGMLYDMHTHFSMAENFYPADAHLFGNPVDTVYSTEHIQDRLKGFDVSWITLGEKDGNPKHMETISRFWHLYIQRAGGAIEYLSKYLDDNALDAVVQKKYGFRPKYEMPEPDEDARLYMYHIKPVDREEWIRQPANTTPPPSSAVSGKMKIGLKWVNSKVDLDLYVRPETASKELYYRNVREPYGIFFKDIIEGNPSSFEYVDVTKPFHTDEIHIGVNLFRNRAVSEKTQEFQLMLFINGEKYEKTFSFPLSLPGNRGRDKETRNTSPHWVVIKASDLLPSAAS